MIVDKEPEQRSRRYKQSREVCTPSDSQATVNAISRSHEAITSNPLGSKKK